MQYNLALAYFKEEKYSLAVENFKQCSQIDKQHPYAYNNLAFIYNMHKYYQETIIVCNTAKLHCPDGPASLNCLRHWAFALFKKGDMGKAIKKIKKAVEMGPGDPDNWIVWGLIMRTVGSYPAAKHKFDQALKLDPDNQSAQFEMRML